MLPEALALAIRQAGGDALLLDSRHSRALLSDLAALVDICRNLQHAGFTRYVDFSGEHLEHGGEGEGDVFALRLTLRAPAHGHSALTLKWKFRLGPDGPAHPTLSKVWPGAGVAEREIFEMLGLPFSGNDNLRPLLLDEQFIGNPLRLDFVAAAHGRPAPRTRGAYEEAGGSRAAPTEGGAGVPADGAFDAADELQRRYEAGVIEALRSVGGARWDAPRAALNADGRAQGPAPTDAEDDSRAEATL